MKKLTLTYWLDDNWYVGQLEEIPSVFSQGETLGDLEKNINEVYSLMFSDVKNEAPIGAINFEQQDETEYLLSSEANARSLELSLQQLSDGDVVYKTIEELKNMVNKRTSTRL